MLRLFLMTGLALLASRALRGEAVARTWRMDAADAAAPPHVRIEPVGAPALAERIVLVEVPAGTVFSNLSWSVTDWAVQTDEVPHPVPRPCTTDAAPLPTSPDPAFYARDVWPVRPVEALGVVCVQGARKLRVRVSPERWRGGSWAQTGTGTVEVARGLSFTAQFAPSAASPVVPRRAAARTSAGHGLVIVAPPDLRTAWDDYAAQRRRALPDWAVRVVGTDEIYRDIPFGAEYACRNAAESIHAFLRAEAARGTDHVLLGGAWLDAQRPDDAVFFETGERLSLSNCVPGVRARPHVAEKCDAVPSDLFFACLDDAANGIDHPWDPNGNGVYLDEEEWADCDIAADLAVGRFAPVPFDDGSGILPTPAQLITNYAAKVARGAGMSFSGADRVGLVSEFLWASAPKAGPALGRPHPEQAFFDEVPNVWTAAHPATVTDGEWATRETLRTVIAPRWPVRAVESLHAHAGGTLFSPRHGSLSAARTAFFAQDLLLALCRTHGTVQSAGGNVTRGRVSEATGLTLFNEFSVPCHTGAVDAMRTNATGVCVLVPSLGQVAVAAPQGGALTGIHNASYGWGAPDAGLVLSDGYSATLGYLALRRLFVARNATCGLAFLHARQQYAFDYSPKTTRLVILCEQFFFGDPSVGFPSVDDRLNADLPSDGRFAEDWTCVAGMCGDGRWTGPGRMRVMGELRCAGTGLELAAGGGVGGFLAFTGASPGTLTLAGAEAFYVGGVSNCATLVLGGAAKTVDLSGAGSPPAAVSVTGAAATNTLRCTRADNLAATTLDVSGATLRLETAEAFGEGETPLAVVTNGVLEVAESPLAGWDDEAERWARPLVLQDATLRICGKRAYAWGRRAGASPAPFALYAAGRAAVEGTAVGLVGTTRVDVAAGSVLALDADVRDVEAGRMLFSGAGRVVARRRTALAGHVEVARGVTLDLEETPLAVTALVVRAGAVVRIPSEASGWHDLVAGTGTLHLEAGAEVRDLEDRALAGSVVGGSFFEASGALCWRGGAGAWSDPDGWRNPATGAVGPWQNGRAAVFDASAALTNDLADVQAERLVFTQDARLDGRALRLASGWISVPAGTCATFAAPLDVAGELVKYGEGTLVVAGAQTNLAACSLRVEAGTCGLDGLCAPGVTNLSVAAGARLLLRGVSALTNACARGTLATNALACADGAAATLVLGALKPKLRGLALPAGLTLVVAARELEGCCAWNIALDGMLDYRGILSLGYARPGLEGPGTVRAEGLRSDSPAGARIGACRLELAGRDGLFPVYEDVSWGDGNVRFDGATLAPTGGALVVTSAGHPTSRTTLFVDEGGVTFDVPAGACLTLGGEQETFLFGGPGGVVKRGAGTLRFATVDDLHGGPTVIHAGVYELGTATATADVALEGGTLAFTSDEPQGLGLTNCVLATGSALKLRVTPLGADVLDVRGGVFRCAAGAALEVRVLPGAPAGDYALLVVDAADAADLAALACAVHAPGRRAETFLLAVDGAVVRVVRLHPPATAILLR